MAVVGAIIGAGAGGLMNGRFERRSSILIADLLFLAICIVVAFAPALAVIIVGWVISPPARNIQKNEMRWIQTLLT
jgi:MFS transporter, SP family, solute carrier family 2 (myo-inositol transporter), member 13